MAWSCQYAGNPAAVCFLDSRPRDEVWMAKVAREMACSNTAFVKARTETGYDLRWFTGGGVEVEGLLVKVGYGATERQFPKRLDGMIRMALLSARCRREPERIW